MLFSQLQMRTCCAIKSATTAEQRGILIRQLVSLKKVQFIQFSLLFIILLIVFSSLLLSPNTVHDVLLNYQF